MKTGQKAAGFDKADLAVVSDNPELDRQDLARLRPAQEVLPQSLFKALSRPKGGRPRKPDRKIALTLRLDPDIVANLKAGGPGWQTRINAILRQAVSGGAKASR